MRRNKMTGTAAKSLFRNGSRWKLAGAGILVLVGLAGCGGSMQQNNNDTVPGSTQVHTYVGTQTFIGTFGGVYSLTTDHNTNYFNLTDETPYALGDFNYVGNFVTAGQFQKMNVTEYAAPPLGTVSFYMLEIPGDAAVTELYWEGYLPPVVFAESNSCQPLTSPTTFQFIDLDAFDYGSVTVNSTGSTWSFSNYSLTQMNGASESPAALPNGACGATAEGYAATIPETQDELPITYTTAISPNGYFVMDRDMGALPNGEGGNLGALVGMVQPSSPLSDSPLIAANYAGFEYDSLQVSPQTTNGKYGSNPGMQPVSFSGANATSSQMVGGIFPSGDPTQTPSTDIGINLGTQSTSQNGLYPAVTVSLPDPTLKCAETTYAGTSASGSPTCVFAGFAMAGNPGGKFVVFVTIDVPINSQRGPTPVQFLLYQQ